MAKHSKKQQPRNRATLLVLAIIGCLLVSLGIFAALKPKRPGLTNLRQETPTNAFQQTATNSEPAEMEVAKAVMVTQELDLGQPVPSIAQALNEIERRHAPSDGKGRTFAILDAYGNPTPDGKLHISMHVSSEKPGRGSLVLKRTGQVLWEAKIVPSSNAPPFSGKELTILLDQGGGKNAMVDGSKNPSTILDAGIRGTTHLVRDIWPEDVEREVTFIYSACGCPVKVKVKRVGDRTVRTSDMPVMFPDDPGVLVVINRLMGWQ